MNCPHALLLRGKTFEADVLAFDRLNDAWASRHLAATKCQVSGNRARPNNGDAVREMRGNQRAVRIDPTSFPTAFHNRVVVEIRAAKQRRVFFKA